MNAAATGTPFLFGKLPAHGDFVSRGLGDTARQAWDDWATQALERLRAAHDDFEAAHDAAPPWRFISGPSVLGEGWRAGALAPSVDGAGRRFILAVGVGGWSSARAAGCGQAAAAAMEDVLYRALAEGLAADSVMDLATEQLIGLGEQAAVGDALGAGPGQPGVWWSAGLGLAPRIAATPPANLLTSADFGLSENAA